MFSNGIQNHVVKPVCEGSNYPFSLWQVFYNAYLFLIHDFISVLGGSHSGYLFKLSHEMLFIFISAKN